VAADEADVHPVNVIDDEHDDEKGEYVALDLGGCPGKRGGIRRTLDFVH
jgi:hypothetical protein